MENSEPGENPGRYRRCMRGGTARDESQSLGAILRRQCGELMIRESEDLLKCVECLFALDVWRNGRICFAEKRLRQSYTTAAVFVLQGGTFCAVFSI